MVGMVESLGALRPRMMSVAYRTLGVVAGRATSPELYLAPTTW
jgi:hypothetical protein